MGEEGGALLFAGGPVDKLGGSGLLGCSAAGIVNPGGARSLSRERDLNPTRTTGTSVVLDCVAERGDALACSVPDSWLWPSAKREVGEGADPRAPRGEVDWDGSTVSVGN